MNTLSDPPDAFPDEEALDAAGVASRQLANFLASGKALQRIELVGRGDERQIIELPVFALSLLGNMLAEFAAGNAVQIVPISAELSTQQAARILNVSRPHMVKLLDQGALPYTKTGTHRRIRFPDLMAFKAQREAASYSAMDELAVQAQALRMGYE